MMSGSLIRTIHCDTVSSAPYIAQGHVWNRATHWKSKPNLDINNIDLRGVFLRRAYLPTTGRVLSFSDGQPIALG